MTSSSNFFQSTHPTGRVLWEELLVLSRFHPQLRADEWNICPLCALIRLNMVEYVPKLLSKDYFKHWEFGKEWKR